MENKKIEVNIFDHYNECVEDSLNKNKLKKGNPSGFVEIYEKDENGNKKLLGEHNLVLYLGREWLLSRAFNTDNENISPTKDGFISWFGLGSGGCIPGDPFDPISPTISDVSLTTECAINTDNVDYADFRDGSYYKIPFDSLVFTQDPDNDNAYLIMELTMTVGSYDANGNGINEAGLYINESNVGGAVAPFYMFSKITFPTITKIVNRQLIFNWYIYF